MFDNSKSMYIYKPLTMLLSVWIIGNLSFEDIKLALLRDVLENLFKAGDTGIGFLTAEISSNFEAFAFIVSVDVFFNDDDETNAELIAEILLMLISLDFVTPGWVTGQLGVVDANLRCPYGQHR